MDPHAKDVEAARRVRVMEPKQGEPGVLFSRGAVYFRNADGLIRKLEVRQGIGLCLKHGVDPETVYSKKQIREVAGAEELAAQAKAEGGAE